MSASEYIASIFGFVMAATGIGVGYIWRGVIDKARRG